MSTGAKNEAFLKDAKTAAGVDVFGNIHVLNTDSFGTLNVNATLATEPTIDIGAVSIIPASSALITQVSVTSSQTSVLSSNSNRKSLIIQNIGTSSVFISLTNTVSTSMYSFSLGSSLIFSLDNYDGVITAISNIGMTNILQVTEII